MDAGFATGPAHARASAQVRAALFAWGCAALLALLLRPAWSAMAAWLPSCTFHDLTGFACPTCGTARAALALLHGRPLAALSVNPLAAAAGAAFLGGGLLALGWAVAGLPVPVGALGGRRGWTLALGIAVAANWVYLILAGT